MSVLLTYAILFFSSAIFGVGLLSWFQTFYLQGQPGRYVIGLPVTLSVTLGLCVAIVAIIFFVVHPMDKIISKIKNGAEPTDEDRNQFMKLTNSMNQVTVVATVIGFVFGNVSTIVIQILKGGIVFYLPSFLFAIIHSISFGSVALMYSINLMDHFLSAKRKLLRIRETSKNQAMRSMTSTLLYMFIASFVALASSIAMICFQCMYQNQADFYGSTVSFLLSNSVIVFALVFVFCMIPFVIVLRGISKRLKENSNLILELAESGDLIHRIDIVVDDEFGLLASAVNKLMDKLSQMILSIREQSSHVSNSAEQITNSTQTSVSTLLQMSASLSKINQEGSDQRKIIKDVSEDISGLKSSAKELSSFMIEQSSAMQENSVSISQMSSNIKKVAEMTRQADELITKLVSVSDRGNSLVASSITAITDIQQASIEVQKIVKVIQGLASQTNLLSMNAAIEAAHAGEFGAGFAVVANEVRSLAEDSSKSAKNIQGYISDMVAKISAGVSTSKQAGDAFKEIEESVRENQQILQSLTNAMEEQRTNAEENMRVTSDVTNALVHANDLAQSQDEFVERVKETMANVISITDEISSCINEGMTAVNNMQNSISQVQSSVATNKDAVDKMESQMSLFNL